MNPSPSSPGTPSLRPVGFREVFGNRLFAIVWAGAFVSNIGNWMENSAQNWAIVAALRNNPVQSAFLSEILNFADFAPALLLVLFAGVITDRVNLRRYLLWLQSLACLLGAGLAVTAWYGYASPWVVIAFTFAEGIVWALNGPPWQTLVPHLVPRPQLATAIAANSAQFNLARLVGPFIAGLIILRFGVAGAFFVNAATFIPVIFALWTLPPDAGRTHAPRGHRPILKDLFSGIRIVRRQPGLRRLAIMLAAFTFLAAPAQGLLAVYVKVVMHGDSRLYGTMLGGIGLGALLGAFVIGKIPSYYPRHHLIPLAMSMGACFILFFTFFALPWICFLGLTGVGFFWMLSINSSNAAAQLLAGDENRGRIMSVILLCIQGFMPLGHLFASVLAHLMGPAWIIRCMVGALLLIALGFLIRREPAIDAMTRRDLPRAPLTWYQHLWEALTAQSHRPVPVPLKRDLADEGRTVPDVPRNG